MGATWTAGRHGSALSFNGTNARVDLPALGTFYKTGFTLEAWVNRSEDEQGRRHRRYLGLAAERRADAVGRPHRRPSPSDVQRRPLQLPRLGTGARHRPVAVPQCHVRRHDRQVLRQRDAGRHEEDHRQRRRLEQLAHRSVRRHSLRVLQGSHRRRAHLQPRPDRGRGAVGHERAGRVRHGRAVGASRLREDRRRACDAIATGWTASTDNVGVAGYRVFRGGTQVATTTSTSYTFTGLACGTSYDLGVEALDDAQNVSSRTPLTASSGACDTTAPTVSITTPSSGDTVAGSTAVGASASDANGRRGRPVQARWEQPRQRRHGQPVLDRLERRRGRARRSHADRGRARRLRQHRHVIAGHRHDRGAGRGQQPRRGLLVRRRRRDHRRRRDRQRASGNRRGRHVERPGSSGRR